MMTRMLIQRLFTTRSTRRFGKAKDTGSKLDQATMTAEKAPKLSKKLEKRIKDRVPGKDPEADKVLGKQLKYEDDVDKLM